MSGGNWGKYSLPNHRHRLKPWRYGNMVLVVLVLPHMPPYIFCHYGMRVKSAIKEVFLNGHALPFIQQNHRIYTGGQKTTRPSTEEPNAIRSNKPLIYSICIYSTYHIHTSTHPQQ